MPFIFFIGLLFFFNWLFSEIIVFIPINLGHFLDFIAHYIFLGLLMIVLSWLLGK